MDKVETPKAKVELPKFDAFEPPKYLEKLIAAINEGAQRIDAVASGKVRGLAVNGPGRSKLVPELPTMKESGVNMTDESSWYGFFAPKGTPKSVIDKINRDLQTVIDMPDMREKELALGYRFIGGPPSKLAEFLPQQIAKWEKLAKSGSLLAK